MELHFTLRGTLQGFAAVIAALALLAVAIAGLIALWKFLAVSLAFIWSGRSNLLAYRAKFRSGLLWAILPLCLMIPFAAGAVDGFDGLNIIVIAYVTGLTLLVPVAHLWAELRERAVAST